MRRHTMLVVLALQVIFLTAVQSAQQKLKLSDSYLPVAMQIILHLTDQMAYETRDDVTPSTARTTTKMTTPSSTSNTWTTKPTSWTTKPTTSTTKPTSWTTKPTTSTTKPSWTTTPFVWTTKTTTPAYVWTTKPWTTSTTAPPYVWTTKPTGWTTSTSPPYVWTTKPGWATWTTKPTTAWTNGWWTTKRPDQTTPFHAPGLFAPFAPPKPFYNRYQSRDFLLPMYNSQYTVLGPENQQTRSEDPLLAVHHEEVKPLVGPTPDEELLLPPHFDVKISSRSDGFQLDDISEESLQYLSEDVREMIRMAKDPNDERVVDLWERSGPKPVATKAKMSSSNLRLLLLYDLLSRDAKAQKLSEYNGFSADVMKVLVESSSGGARAQLRMALDKMVQRKDCNHEYANNRAREMVEELGRDESKMSSELRYLQPLVYKY